MADYTTNASVVLTVNGKQAQMMLEDLKKRAVELEKKIKMARDSGDSKGLKKYQNELKNVKKSINQIENAGKKVSDVLRRLDKATPWELNKALTELKRQLNGIERGSEAWNRHTEKIKRVKNELSKLNNELKTNQSFWQRLFSGLEKFKVTILGTIGAFTGLTAITKKSVEAFAEMDEAMANTRKFTGLSEEGVKALNEEFKKMDTRTSREQLNLLAQEAGRLGKTSQEDIMGYVKAADVLNVALSDLGDGATQKIAKLSNIFGIEETEGTYNAMMKIGSTINVLSQNCSASKPFLVDFTNRLAGVGNQANIAIHDIIGLGAALDANGQKVEASSTAISQVLTRMFVDPSKYAKVAGLNVTEFTNLLKTNANEALLQFLEALNKAGNMDALAPMFKEMGENGARAQITLAVLAKHIDEVRIQQLNANKAFEEGTSALHEFEIFNNTTQAAIDKARKNIQDLSVELGEKLLPIMKHIMTSGTLMLEFLNESVDFIKENWRLIISLTAALVSYVAVLKATSIYQSAVSMGQATMKTTALALQSVYLLLTGRITAAKNAWMLFSASIKANPLGLLISLLTVAGGAIWNYASKTKEATKKLEEAKKKQEEWKNSLIDLSDKIEESSKKEISSLEKLYKAATNQTRSTLERERAAKRLIDQYPDYFAKLSKEQIMLGNAKAAYDKLRDSILEVARAEAIKAKITENEGKSVDIELELDDLYKQKELQEARLNGAKMSYNAIEKKYNSNHTNYFSKTFLSSAEERQEYVRAKEDVERNGKILGEIETKIKENEQKKLDIKNANESLQGKVKFSDSEDSEETSADSSYTPGISDKEAKKAAAAAAKKAKAEFKAGLNAIKDEEIKAFNEAEALRNTGQINFLQYIEAKRLAEEKFYDDSMKFYEDNLKTIKDYNLKDDKDYSQLQLKKTETMQKYENQRISYSAEAIRRQSTFEIQQLEEQYRWKENRTIIDEIAQQEEVLAIKVKYLEQERDLHVQGTKEWEDLQLQIEKTVEDDRFKKEIAYQNAVQALRKKFAKITIDEEYKLQVKTLEYLRDQGKITVEEFQRMLSQIEIDYEVAKKKDKASLPGADYSRTSSEKREQRQTDVDLKLKELQKAKEEGRITLEEFERMTKKVNQEAVSAWLEPLKNCGDEWVNLLTNMGESWFNFFDSLGEGDWVESLSGAMQTAVAVMGAVMQQMTTFTEAELTIQTAAVEKRYDREITLAEGNTYKTKKLEKQKEKELAQLKNEANRKMFAMQIIQAIAQTATNALTAYGSALATPIIGPTLAPIAAGIAVASGMVQVAAIKKQQQASEAQGYSQGGFTPFGPVDQPVGIVHAGEWVASQKLVNNPQTRPLLEALDYAQRTNTVGSITRADVSRSITAPMAMASGSVQSPNVIVNVPERTVEDNKVLNESLDRLNDRLDKPFVTVNTVTGDNGIKKAQDDYNQLMKNKSPRYKK